jgi:3-dehydroquinate synthase
MAESVILTKDVRSELQAFLNNRSFTRIAVLADHNTRRHCLPVIQQITGTSSLILIPPGEVYKNLATCELIWDEMTKAGLDRKSLLINLGGGVIGDMGGFCASAFKRGIAFVNLPTTLLSMVDASVGGKLGIDFKGYKNHIGFFAMPDSVVIDAVFLKTLPENELRSGFAEVIKHCLIRDEAKWDGLRLREFRDQPWDDLIAHSVRIKSEIVAEDPRESGIRKILNFGHTLGHAIESYFLDINSPVLHGEAVAAGMICELFLSEEVNGLDGATAALAREYILKTFGKLEIDAADAGKILNLTLQDKKNEGGELRFSLLAEIGKTSHNVPVSREQAEKALIKYVKI